MKIFTRSRAREISARIAARFWPPRFPHLAEITAEIAARSRRDTGNLGGQNLATISPICGKSRRPKTRRDLAAILAEMREISAGKYAARCCSEIAARYGNLGGQNAPWSRGDIAARHGYLGGQFRGEVSVGVLPGFAARNEIPGSQNLTVIPSRSEILGSQIRFDENDIYIYVNN